MKHFCFLYLLLMTFFPLKCFSQFVIPDVPSHKAGVYDYANILMPAQKELLERELASYSTDSIQIMVVIVQSLKGYSAKEVATDWVKKWDAARAGNSHSIFILAAVQEQDAIVLGNNAQGKLPDATAETIAKNHIIPGFKKRNLFYGINIGVHAIFMALNGYDVSEPYVDDPKIQPSEGGVPVWIEVILLIAIFIGIFVVIRLLIRRSGSKYNNRRMHNSADSRNLVTFSSSGTSAGSWGSAAAAGNTANSGGFKGGFGGGSFSGGGAGGKW